jgi:hypothetical protein
MRSQYLLTGLKQSLTEKSWLCADSSCCSTGATLRRAKISPGKIKTGSRLIVAVAAPVIMLVAPGPMEERQAKVCKRFLTLV